MTTTRGYTAVRIDFVDARAEKLSFTAKKDIFIEGENGASVTISKGEKFYAVRAGSLGENMFYIVRCIPGVKKCSCPSCKVCVHELHVKNGRPLADLKAEVEARTKERAKSRKAAKLAQQEDKPSAQEVVQEPAKVVDISTRGTLNGAQSSAGFWAELPSRKAS